MKPKQTIMNHRDSTKITFICPSCDRPYYQEDKGIWEQKSELIEKQAKAYYSYYHKCHWKK